MNKNGKSLNTYFIVILILLGLTYFISTLNDREEVYTRAELMADLDSLPRAPTTTAPSTRS